jgi:hypothetical protein
MSTDSDRLIVEFIRDPQISGPRGLQCIHSVQIACQPR